MRSPPMTRENEQEESPGSAMRSYTLAVRMSRTLEPLSQPPHPRTYPVISRLALHCRSEQRCSAAPAAAGFTSASSARALGSATGTARAAAASATRQPLPPPGSRSAIAGSAP